MHELQRQQTHELLQSHRLQYALFTTLDSVKWLTGFAPPLEHLGQPHVFAGGPSLVWYEAGHYTLLVLANYESLGTPLKSADLDIATYSVYDIQAPMQPIEQIVNAFRGVLGSSSFNNVGVELRSATGALLQTLGNPTLTPMDDWLVPLRMIKTDEEMKKLRHNFMLSDFGHQIVQQTLQAGKSEIDIWMDIHSAINRRLGYLVPLGNDCVSSSRQENVGGWPTDIVINAGDSLTVDLSTIDYGYWSDSCRSYFATEPTAKQKEIYQIVLDALDFGLSLLKPGAVASEIDTQLRDFIQRAGYPVYPHHSGHSVGVAGHEAPRIVPYNNQKLQQGMVIMLEPGIYVPGEISVRLEDAALITADGCEILTHHIPR
jgi:Xaa-Pro aminopeptidase